MSTNPSLTSIGMEHIDGAIAQTMVQSSPDCVKVLDEDGRIQYMSDNGMCAMEIDDFEAVRGRFWWELWPEEATATLRSSVQAANGGVATEFEAACPTAKGQPKWWKVRVRRIEGGNLGGLVLATSEDVTAHKRSVERNVRFQRENDALRQLTRFVAHDLKNPIRQISLLTEMMSTELEHLGVGPDALRSPRMLRESADALMRIVVGLQDLQAIDGDVLPGRTSISRVKPDIMACLSNEMLAELRVRWTGDCETYLAVNHGLLVMALKNLIENAWKYGRNQSEVEVVIHTDVGTDLLRISVLDSGPGFPAGTDESVFDSFRRLENATGISGTGTGLAIVKHIAMRYGGRAVLSRDADGVARGVLMEIRDFK